MNKKLFNKCVDIADRLFRIGKDERIFGKESFDNNQLIVTYYKSVYKDYNLTQQNRKIFAKIVDLNFYAILQDTVELNLILTFIRPIGLEDKFYLYRGKISDTRFHSTILAEYPDWLDFSTIYDAEDLRKEISDCPINNYIFRGKNLIKTWNNILDNIGLSFI